MSFYIIWLFLYAVSMSERNNSTYADSAWHIVPLTIKECLLTFLTCECNSGTRNIAVRAAFTLKYTAVISDLHVKCWCINGFL
jgi:hypothetical protein